MVSDQWLVVMGDVQQPLGKNRSDMLIIQRIKHGAALFARLDKTGLAQYAELVGDGRLCHIEKHSDITDTHFCPKERINNVYTGGIAKNFEQISQFHQVFFGRHVFLDIVDHVMMNHITVAADRVWVIMRLYVKPTFLEKIIS